MSNTGKSRPIIKRNRTKTTLPTARQQNTAGRETYRLSTSQDLTKTPTGYKYGDGRSGFPWSKTSFGRGRIDNSLAQPQFTVYAGRGRVGDGPYVSVATSVHTITVETTYIQFEWTWADGSAAVVNSGSTEKKANTDKFYQTLYILDLDAVTGKASIAEPGICHIGDVVLPGSFGDF